jgi:cytochrome c peroxidase
MGQESGNGQQAREMGMVRFSMDQGGMGMGISSNRRRVQLGGRKLLILAGALCLAAAASAMMIPSLFPFLDPTGVVSTYNANGPIDESTPFFQSLGTNGRSCASCHVVGNAMGLSTQNIQQRFLVTRGGDPLFAAFDGANCPNTGSNDPATHSLLLKNGLIRIPIQLPATAQFSIRAAVDPYGCAVVTDPISGLQTVSVYRRPLPTTNLRFLSTIMFDGRETIAPLNNSQTFQANLVTDLMHQSVDATTGHAQATVPPTTEQQTAIVTFELGLFSAQLADNHAGLLNQHGALGGAQNLSAANYYPGINDTLGADPTGAAFNPAGFTLFSSWENLQAENKGGRGLVAAREQIAAGEKLFNSRALTITSVRGLNDNPALATALGVSLPIASFPGTCTTCHDTPNVGDHSLPLPLDIGTGHDAAQESDTQIANGLAQLSFPGVPVFEITGCPNPFATPGQPVEPYVIYTTDPGKGLVTGLCGDVNRIKGPVLRGLAARAPYFHNGAARDLNELLDFYNQRFQMNLTDEEKSQLIAFLNSL